MSRFIVGRNGDINESERSIGIADGNHGDIDIGCLTNRLVIHSWVGDDDETGLSEGTSDVVGEGTWCKTTSHGDSPSMLSKFKNSTLAIGTSGNCDNVTRILDSGDNSGSENDLLPDFSNVNDVDTYRIVPGMRSEPLKERRRKGVQTHRLAVAYRHKESSLCHSSWFQYEPEQTRGE